MIEAERRAVLEAIADEVRACTRCRLHETRTKAVPGEGHPSTEVVFVGEGPGQNEDRQGHPFVGRAGDLLVKMLATIGWRRDEVFITNVVKCRPPDNRDPEPDEIAACAPYLHRQLEVLDPALIVTLGRHSLGRFRPGARISQVHGTTKPIDAATGARAAMGFALYHPAAALRSTEVERQSYEDVLYIPEALLASRATREATPGPEAPVSDAPATETPAVPELPNEIEPAAVVAIDIEPVIGVPVMAEPMPVLEPSPPVAVAVPVEIPTRTPEPTASAFAPEEAPNIDQLTAF